MQLAYPIPRPLFLADMFSAAEKAGAAAIMPWELVPWHVAPTASGGFDFGIDDESFAPAVQMVSWMKTRVLPHRSSSMPAGHAQVAWSGWILWVAEALQWQPSA